MAIGLGLGAQKRNFFRKGIADVPDLKLWLTMGFEQTTHGGTSNLDTWSDQGNTSNDLTAGNGANTVPLSTSGTQTSAVFATGNKATATLGTELNLAEFSIYTVIDFTAGSPSNEVVFSGASSADNIKFFLAGDAADVGFTFNSTTATMTMNANMHEDKCFLQIRRFSDGLVEIKSGLNNLSSIGGTVSTDINNLFDFSVIGNGGSDFNINELVLFNRAISNTEQNAVTQDIAIRNELL